MSFDSEKKTVSDGEVQKEILELKFSNGAFEQLKSLKDFFGLDDEATVIKLGLSYLEKIREANSKKV